MGRAGLRGSRGDADRADSMTQLGLEADELGFELAAILEAYGSSRNCTRSLLVR